MNLYAYANQNPISYIDPNGQYWYVAIPVAGYVGWNAWKKWKDFKDKAEEAEKCTDDFYENIYNLDEDWADRYSDMVNSQYDAAEAGATIPGTSLTGPLPTSPTDVIITGGATAIGNAGEK